MTCITLGLEAYFQQVLRNWKSIRKYNTYPTTPLPQVQSLKATWQNLCAGALFEYLKHSLNQTIICHLILNEYSCYFCKHITLWWECLLMEYQWDVILFLWINIMWCLCTFVCTQALSKLPEWAVYPKSLRENEHLGIKEIPGPCLCLYIIVRHFLVHLNNRKLSGATMRVVWLDTEFSRRLGVFRHNNVIAAVKRKGKFSSAGFSEPLL